MKKFINNIKYYGLFNYTGKSELYNYFNLNNSTKADLSKLFDLKDRLFYVSSSLVGRDLSDLNSYDSFKDNYQYTSFYSTAINTLNKRNKLDKLIKNEDKLILSEVNKCYDEIDKFIRVYETSYLLSSFHEETKNFISRIQTNSLKKNIRHIFLKNYYDKEEYLIRDFDKILSNYKEICEYLKDYPDWLEKFKFEANKNLAYCNIDGNFNKLYEKVSQQVIFK